MITGRWLMNNGYIDSAGVLRRVEQALAAYPDASQFMAQYLAVLHLQEAAK